MDIFQQQDLLRNLPDTKLQQEAKSPSGAVPPFMVLSEMQRRQTMRRNYLGQKAVYDAKNRTTVAQDLVNGGGNDAADTPPMPPMQSPTGGGLSAAAGPPPGPGGGLSAAAGAPPPPVTQASNAFARGGLVAAAGYASGGYIDALPPAVDTTAAADPYTALMQQLAEERKRNASLALVQAGLGIMGGGSSNTAQNLAGAAPAITAYQSGLSDLDRQQASLLQMHQQQQQEAANRALDERRLTDQEANNASDAKPALQKSFEWYNGLSPDTQNQVQDYASTVAGQGAAGVAGNVSSQRQRASALNREVTRLTKILGTAVSLGGNDLSELAANGVEVPPDIQKLLQDPATKAQALKDLQDKIQQAAIKRINQYGYPGQTTDTTSDPTTDGTSPPVGNTTVNPADPFGLGL